MPKSRDFWVFEKVFEGDAAGADEKWGGLGVFFFEGGEAGDFSGAAAFDFDGMGAEDRGRCRIFAEGKFFLQIGN